MRAHDYEVRRDRAGSGQHLVKRGQACVLLACEWGGITYREAHLAMEMLSDRAEMVTIDRSTTVRLEVVRRFKSLGMAVEDVATARHVYTRARECRMGSEIAI